MILGRYCDLVKFTTPHGLSKFNENLCRHHPRGEFSLVF
ncbi:hypothetical protein CAMSH0001_0217 [Campylobacter showae RM3277]|uniref:Uncharacterized protein n=1 Tax=Campylobacter showae RM3277 TaxID=553219 RepID=C6RI65_9BACT|nr:hypothetical protein CAMSH0001_0217 [Campylobacter showae RM3277]